MTGDAVWQFNLPRMVVGDGEGPTDDGMPCWISARLLRTAILARRALNELRCCGTDRIYLCVSLRLAVKIDGGYTTGERPKTDAGNLVICPRSKLSRFKPPCGGDIVENDIQGARRAGKLSPRVRERDFRAGVPPLPC